MRMDRDLTKTVGGEGEEEARERRGDSVFEGFLQWVAQKPPVPKLVGIPPQGGGERGAKEEDASSK